MKTLYFVGNEELWNDAWFAALVESLKSRSMGVVLMDHVRDAHDLKNVCEKLSAYERLIFHKAFDPHKILAASSIQVPESKSSLLYVFADIINDNASPRHIAWGVDAEEFVRTIGLGEVSQVLEDAFIFDMNLAGEVSKAIEKSEGSLFDSELLSADAAQMERMIDANTDIRDLVAPKENFEAKDPSESVLKVAEEIVADSTVALENEVSLDLESELDIDLAGDVFNESLKVQDEFVKEQALEESFEAKATKIIKPVQATQVEELSIQPAVELPKFEETEAPQDFAEAIPVGAPSVEVSQLISAMSQSVSREDMEVLKRYSSLKERELRESQAAAEALRKQIRYFDERLKKSEEERRKLLLKLDETHNELRTTADKKDENRAQLRSIESRYEEKIKELLVQLESSQFQAGKLDKKLTDFRERVRNDLQKIRSRERELASRLEIQKRDAEALLSAKDERLLNQKREMDRLEFDLDALKERLLDDAQKSEERRKRVARALQSLKLAQSILSGLEEDVVTKDEKDKAA